jgi:hypothetical protein
MDKQKSQCDYCLYYTYDDDYESNVCQMNLDEDESSRMSYHGNSGCSYFRFGNEYTIVKKQI